jgi:hypothetical protein
LRAKAYNVSNATASRDSKLGSRRGETLTVQFWGDGAKPLAPRRIVLQAALDGIAGMSFDMPAFRSGFRCDSRGRSIAARIAPSEARIIAR